MYVASRLEDEDAGEAEDERARVLLPTIGAEAAERERVRSEIRGARDAFDVAGTRDHEDECGRGGHCRAGACERIRRDRDRHFVPFVERRSEIDPERERRFEPGIAPIVEAPRRIETR